MEIFIFVSIIVFFAWLGYASARSEFAGAEPTQGYICTRRQPY